MEVRDCCRSANFARNQICYPFNIGTYESLPEPSEFLLGREWYPDSFKIEYVKATMVVGNMEKRGKYYIPP